VESVDQLGDLRVHHGEDMRAAARREGVLGAALHDEELTRSDALPDTVHEDLELAVETDEGFLACMMDMERRLIPIVRVEPPLSDHEIRHGETLPAGKTSVLADAESLDPLMTQAAQRISPWDPLPGRRDTKIREREDPSIPHRSHGNRGGELEVA